MYLFGVLWIPNFLLWILALVLALYLYSIRTHGILKSCGYDGPKPKPFMGNLDLLFTTGHFASWYPTGKKLYGKVFGMYQGARPTIVSFEPEILKEVLVKRFSSFVNRPQLFLRGNIMRHSLIDIADAKWKRMRNMTSPFFTTGKLKGNMPHLEFCVNNLVAKCKEHATANKPIEAKEAAGAFTMQAICLTAFGVTVDTYSDSNHPLLSAARKMTTISPKYWGLWVGFAFPFTIPFLEWLGCEMWPEGTVDTMARLTKEIIEERRKSNESRPDFLQMLLKAHEEAVQTDSDGTVMAESETKRKPLTEEELIAQVALFVMAGFDTTAAALSFLLYQMAANPDCQQKVLEEIQNVMGDGEVTFDNLKEMTYLRMCMDESLRLYPSTFRGERICSEDVTICGHFIPKGAQVVFPIMALHRDPDFWNDPDKFIPERFSPENKPKINPYVYLPFGLGPRNCVGMRLAQIEIQMVVINIVRRFKVTVSNKTKEPIELEKAFLPRVVGGLWLSLEKR